MKIGLYNIDGEGDDQGLALGPAATSSSPNAPASRTMPAKKKTRENSVEAIASRANPYNWGVKDYTEAGSFNKAWGEAKRAGETEFMYNHKRFSTKSNLSDKEQFEEYGITDKQTLSNSPVRNLIHSQIVPAEGAYGYGDGYGQINPVVTVGNFIKGLVIGMSDDDKVYYGESNTRSNPTRDVFNMYLGKPVGQTSEMAVSDYKPSQTRDNDPNSIYFRMDRARMFNEKDPYLQSLLGGNDDPQDLLSSDSNSVTATNYNLGQFRYHKGSDEKGDYISYYDKWDLHPLGSGEDKPWNILEKFGIVEDQSMGAGKPIEFYDRAYYEKTDRQDVIEVKTRLKELEAAWSELVDDGYKENREELDSIARQIDYIYLNQQELVNAPSIIFKDVQQETRQQPR